MNRLPIILVGIIALVFWAHPSVAQFKDPGAAKVDQEQSYEKKTKRRSRGGFLMLVLDRDRDGVLSATEIENAPESLGLLDQNRDGVIDQHELRFMILPNIGRGYDGHDVPTGLPPMPDDLVPPQKK